MNYSVLIQKFSQLLPELILEEIQSSNDNSILQQVQLTPFAKKWLMENLSESEDDKKTKLLEKKLSIILSKSQRQATLSFGPMFPQERTYFDLKDKDVKQQSDISVPSEIVKFLDKQGYTVQNYQQGLAQSKVHANRIAKIGKLVKSDSDLLKKFNERLSNKMKKTGDLKLVFSYNPRDIILMSTNRGWTSCADILRDPGGSAVKQIPNKIRYGGMVVYVIRSNDMEIENPIARIAIRRFVNKTNGTFILLPEKITYGADIKIFRSQVSEILEKSNQETGGTENSILKDAEGGYSDSFMGSQDIRLHIGKDTDPTLNNVAKFLSDLAKSNDDDVEYPSEYQSRPKFDRNKFINLLQKTVEADRSKPNKLIKKFNAVRDIISALPILGGDIYSQDRGYSILVFLLLLLQYVGPSEMFNAKMFDAFGMERFHEYGRKVLTLNNIAQIQKNLKLSNEKLTDFYAHMAVNSFTWVADQKFNSYNERSTPIESAHQNPDKPLFPKLSKVIPKTVTYNKLLSLPVNWNKKALAKLLKNLSS